MSLVRFFKSDPSVFDRLFEGDLFDWSNRNFSLTNTTLAFGQYHGKYR